MQRSNLKLSLLIISIILLFTLAGIYIYKSRDAGSESQQDTIPAISNTEEKIPEPSDLIMLADSTRIYALDKVSLNLSGRKGDYTATMDGDFFYDIPQQKDVFIIRTRLLKLSVHGKSAFRVIAYNKDEGEEVQVLHGHIVAEKSYKSDFPEPETLKNDNLLMINKSIDLMEKEENLDTRELRKWKNKADSMKVKRYIRP